MQKHLGQELFTLFVEIRLILRVRRVQMGKLHLDDCLQTVQIDTDIARAENILQYASQRCSLLISCFKDFYGAVLHITIVGYFP